MINRLNIRQRILIIFILIVLTGGIVQFLVAGRLLQAATLEFFQHHLEIDAQSVAATFAEPLANIMEGEGTSISQMLISLQQQVGHNYLIVDAHNRVIAATIDSPYGQVDHAPETPELAQARSNPIGADIRPNSAGQDTLYLAVSMNYDGELLGYVVLSDLMQPAYTAVNRHYMELAGATLPVIALVIAASLWISGSISRPVRSLRNSALRMAHGAFDTRIQITSHDEVGQLAESFNYMAEQLEKLMKTQRSFVSNAAHELRTPLMTLKLRAEALADETVPAADRAAYLNEIRSEIDHMAGLVSSLLILARIDDGRQQESRAATETDTVSTLHDVMRHWRIEAEKCGLQFTAHIDPDLPDLPISSNDLRLVLDNLLSNAIKYTPQGRIDAVVSHQNGEFTLKVSDTGVGFMPEQNAHLFERFYRSDEVRGTFEGNGLGLSIVKAILDRCGGRIDAASRGLGQGATFTVHLRPTPVR